MKHTKNAAMISLLLTLVACGGGKGGGSSKPVAKADPVKTETPKPTPSSSEDEPNVQTTASFKVKRTRAVKLKENFSNFDEFKAKMNEHKISFEAISGDYKNSTVECRKNSLSDIYDIPSAKFDSEGQLAVVEVSLSKEDPISVDYDCRVLYQGVKLDSVSINIKKSFLVSGTQNLLTLGMAKDSEIEGLIFDKDAALVTNGADIKIKVNDVISNGGSIQTFSPDFLKTYAPAFDRIGISGGTINLDTNTVTGTLNVVLQGLAAGKNTNNAAAQTYVPGADPALNGQRRGECERGKTSGNGRKGHPGAAGNNGSVGYKGGDSGVLNFKSQQLEGFKLNLVFVPGAGGEGSLGSAGGAGGPGGIGIAYSVPFGPREAERQVRCANGPQGDQGPMGIKGPNGQVGDNLTSTIQIGEEIMKIQSSWSNQ